MNEPRNDKFFQDLALGEGARVEFKERPASLDREMVAFANGGGGSIYLGVNDSGDIVGVEDTNRARSSIYDVARNCDPPVEISLAIHQGGVIEIVVPEGTNKPYRCKTGFYLRVGPNSQKLSRDEIIQLALSEGEARFDGAVNRQFRYPDDFDQEKLERFLELTRASSPGKPEDALVSLDVARQRGSQLLLTQAGVLFFARDPQRHIKESTITCVRYNDTNRYEISDREEINGDLVAQIERAIAFLDRHNARQYLITGDPRRREVRTYAPVAIREAVINAVMHRDYFYNASHIYVHLFSNRLEIENPGGLYRGLTIEELGTRSVRRNPAIADLLYRAKYVERLGSGISRMQTALKENNNPPMEISATNFFTIRFLPRAVAPDLMRLTTRQARVLGYVRDRGVCTKDDVARFLNVGNDTALRELKVLLENKLIERRGRGRATQYILSA